MSRADEILLIPGLCTMRQSARYSSGKPLMMTVTHAGSTCRFTPACASTKLRIRKTPPTAVIGIPARKSLIFFM